VTSDLKYSPGLDQTYGPVLGEYVRSLTPGESIFWTRDGWSRSGPGVEFVKDDHGFIRPKRRRREDD
jgi:hypothetical protein